MDRLRGLFSDAGLANLQRNRAPLSQEQQPPVRQSAAGLPPAPARRFDASSAAPSMPVAAEKTAASAPAAQVIAKPEILPPREFIPVKIANHKRDAEPVEEDDILILPAKRGQYTSR